MKRHLRIDAHFPRNPTIRAKCVEMRRTHSAREIAEKLGITRNAVIGHWYRARKDVEHREASI